MTRIIFDRADRYIDPQNDTNILDAAKRMGIGISAVCGGKGLCGKCRVVVKTGREKLGPLSNLERLSLSDLEIISGYRLACLATPVAEGEIFVKIPPESSIEQQRLQVAGIETIVRVSPTVTKHVIEVPPPRAQESKSDAERLIAACSTLSGTREVKLGLNALTLVPTTLRRSGSITVTLYENSDTSEVTWIEETGNSDLTLGLAVDVGTTKLAAYLLNLQSGKTIAVASSLNPQISFGDDVISRISYTSRDAKNLRQLQGIVVAAINKLIHDLCDQTAIEASQISDVAVVGNTAMHHLLLGINPKSLGLSPYRPSVTSKVIVSSKEIGIRVNPGAYVYAFPIIGGFVGGDAVANILATQLHKLSAPALLIDIGTNTEVVLNDGSRLTSCSCASGPALEGGCIEHGMRAETGAIERVYIDPESREPGYTTIGGAPARGICGSGILDAVACMLKTGIVDSGGRIATTLSTPRIRVRNRIAEYVLAEAKDTAGGINITVTQKDVQSVQLAKAAIFAATSILMKQQGINSADLQQIFLAGAFGTYIDPQSALIVGLYPDIPLDRIRFVGNSAGSGARIALISREARSEAEQIAGNTEYVELAANRGFQDEFMRSLYLPHKNPEIFPTVRQILSRSRSY
jgi:uncharacterized 2Fe-2S/4Fe-4S cluster protein (DUF4445 family)